MEQRSHIEINFSWLVKTSAMWGVKIGAVVSVLYTLFLMVTLLVWSYVTFQSGEISERSFSIGVMVTITLGTVLGIVVGIVPSMVIGAVTATLISLTLWQIRSRLTLPWGIVIGLAICGVIAYLTELILIPIDLLMWHGPPTILFTLAGGLTGWKLAKLILAERD